jgi:hypothetical protein
MSLLLSKPHVRSAIAWLRMMKGGKESVARYMDAGEEQDVGK